MQGIDLTKPPPGMKVKKQTGSDEEWHTEDEVSAESIKEDLYEEDSEDESEPVAFGRLPSEKK